MRNHELYAFISQVTPNSGVGVLRTEQPRHGVEHYEFFSGLASPTVSGDESEDNFSVTAFHDLNNKNVVAISIVVSCAEGVLNFNATGVKAVERMVNWVLSP